MVRHHVARRLDEYIARKRWVVVDEHFVPWNLDVFEDQHTIAFVEPGGDRCVEPAGGLAGDRRARPQCQAGQIEWDNAGDRFGEPVRCDWQDVADSYLVGDCGPGG